MGERPGTARPRLGLSARLILIKVAGAGRATETRVWVGRTTKDELAYLRHRARQEHVAALRAGDERVRFVHLRMAQLYRQRIRALTVARLRHTLDAGIPNPTRREDRPLRNVPLRVVAACT